MMTVVTSGRRRQDRASRSGPRHGVPAIFAVSLDDDPPEHRLGPRVTGAGSTADATADTFLGLIGLSKFANRYPGELSGGMQQRVGIARALANYPSVLLMDEPFGALDAQTRVMMQESLLQIWSEFGITVMFVTHDVDEALFLADRVLVMSASPGRIIADLTVPIPRPRSLDIATHDDFIRLKRICLEKIRAESIKAFDQQLQ
jgi:NitT/TauT family transport system ATP-binding protein